MLLRILTCASAALFLVYGVLCLASLSMVADFSRFGLDSLRLPTGFLEVSGGAGLLVGLRWHLALVLASAGLALLMLIAFCVRLRMRDSFAESLPSALLMLVNLYIFTKSLQA